MTKDNAAPQDTQEESQEEEPPVTPIQPATPLTEDHDLTTLPPWAQTLVKELNRENMTRRKAEADRSAAQRIKDQKALGEQGEYKKLSQTLEAELLELRPIRERYEKRIADDEIENTDIIGKIPEQFHSVIPIDYAPDKLAQWLRVNASKLTQPAAPDIDAGAGGGSSRAKPITLDTQQKEYAKMSNMTEEEYAAQLNKK